MPTNCEVCGLAEFEFICETCGKAVCAGCSTLLSGTGVMSVCKPCSKAAEAAMLAASPSIGNTAKGALTWADGKMRVWTGEEWLEVADLASPAIRADRKPSRPIGELGLRVIES